MLTTPRVLLIAVLLGAIVALTAIDKYDEASCRDARAEAASRTYDWSLRRRGGGACEGFLPW